MSSVTMPASEILVLLLKATALFLAGLALLRFARQSTPAVRYLICFFAITGSLAILGTEFLPESAVIIRMPVSAELVPSGHAGSVGLSLTGWVLALWASGCGLVLLRLPIGFTVLWRIRRSAVAFESIAAPVFLADVNVPLLTGFFRPVILLPRIAADWPQSRRDAAIRHELAHLERNDLRFNLARAIACAVYWFHPLVWILARRMSAEQESACDDRVLRSGFDRADYADALVQTACCANRGFLPGCAMTSRSGVKARVVRVLSGPTGKGKETMNAVFAVLVFVFVAAGSLGAERIYAVGGDVAGPAVLYRVQPHYTEAAKKAKLQGTVRVKFVVDSNGMAQDAVIVRGIGLGLDGSALQALQQWRFRPATRNARPVAVIAAIDVNFRLR
jgi:TonB family protein